MHRRSFLVGLFAASSTSVVMIGSGDASPLTYGAQPLGNGTQPDLPIETVQWHHRRPRRQVCTWRRNRFGRRVRICRWV